MLDRDIEVVGGCSNNRFAVVHRNPIPELCLGCEQRRISGQ
jgi:hypothetical protein